VSANATAVRGRNLARARRVVPVWLRAVRVRQWVKNLLVAAAPAAAGVLGQPVVLIRTAGAAAMFVLASAGTYLLNDARDATRDRLHPAKRLRPVAAGVLSTRAATTAGMATILLAMVGSLMWQRNFGLVITAYVLVTSLYSWRLKNVAVLEIMLVAAGFLLRAVGGGVVNNLPLSQWFLLVSASGALLLVSGKRQAELRKLPNAATHRPAIAQYSPEWIGQTTTVALTTTVVGYCLWAFQYLGHDVLKVLIATSVAPFTAAMLRYTLLLSQGHGQQPERLLFTDPFLIAAGITCAGLLFCGIYLA
jgi:decaprenyl-phosphate phosphoribosyltransferase